MNCKQCNQPISEGDVFCKYCGCRHQQEEQPRFYEPARPNFVGVLLNRSRASTFLIFAICFTVMMASQLISTLTSGIGGFIAGLIPAICMLIAMIALWSTYNSKDPIKFAKNIKRAALYDAYLSVIYKILCTITMFGYIGIMILLGVVLYKIDPGFSKDSIGLIIKVSLVALVIIIIIARFGLIYENRKKYFKALANCAATGEYNLTQYNLKKAPVFGSYLLGGWSVLTAIGTFLSSILIGFLMNLLIGFLQSVDLGDGFSMIENLLKQVQNMLMGNSIAAILSGLSSLVLGAYYIFSAIWMSNTHRAICEADSNSRRTW